MELWTKARTVSLADAHGWAARFYFDIAEDVARKGRIASKSLIAGGNILTSWPI
jgi:hypothetical protein